MKTAIGLVIFILILPFVVNIPDAQLGDDAQKLLNVQTAPLKPRTDNGFYALLGLEARLGKNIYEAGNLNYTYTIRDAEPTVHLYFALKRP